MSAKAHTSTLIRALKVTLKSRNITYEDLARRLKLSHASVKRLFAEETFTLKRIEDICLVLEIDFFDLARLARGASADTNEMTTAQEQALAADAKLLGMFYLVFNDWNVDAILATYQLTPAECTALLLQLDRLGLIELGAKNAVRLKVPKTIRLQRDGPIRRSHGRSVMSDFLQADFAAQGGFFRFEFRDLSRASVTLLERKLERIAQELHELAELDSYLPADQRQTIGMALGTRPWTMSWVTGLKKRASPSPEGQLQTKTAGRRGR
ncbi:MAG: helix-turn-helix transcriptional regulator [Rhodocyclaceae bacterium]|jgi:DNA-binding Xre family transcriptional regulator|nr:helix-turn-helix transcriptional regulator [Rhodocyclaceae bacterium]MCA3061558.1 helix-turn-helix transcriptional regulator [Rhodocyclaceae bacterium]MCA3082378.1 helix-turn-helix transcriptional regulator [Rhodocyclaceae bacterium]